MNTSVKTKKASAKNKSRNQLIIFCTIMAVLLAVVGYMFFKIRNLNANAYNWTPVMNHNGVTASACQTFGRVMIYTKNNNSGDASITIKRGNGTVLVSYDLLSYKGSTRFFDPSPIATYVIIANGWGTSFSRDALVTC